MHDLLALFHRIYDVQALVRVGGLLLIAGVVFAETGLLVGFFLPGDSLLFTAGIYCTSANPSGVALLNIVTLNLLVIVAAVVGDTVGYWIGAKAGPKIFTREQSLFFSRKHLLRTKEFYERHGGKTIIMARFMPFVRTFTPVVAGVSYMRYPVYLGFDIVGGTLWGGGVTVAGYFLGTVPFVHQNLEKIILAILFVSLLPALISAGRIYRGRRRAGKETPAAKDEPDRLVLPE